MKMLPLIAVGFIFFCMTLQSHAEMYPVTTSDKTFFEQMRKAVLADDIKWLSEAVSYPMTFTLGKTKYKLKSKKDFTANASSILTSHLKLTIQNQSPNSLFKDWQGVMIGNGEIWYSEIAETKGTQEIWVQRIIGINLPRGR